MRKNRTMRVAALLLALTLITSCFVGGTFAKYATTANAASGTATAAAWFTEIKLDAGTTAASNAKVVANKMAPGTSGTITFIPTVTGTPEVDWKLTLTGTATAENVPSTLKFTLNGGSEMSFEDLKSALAAPTQIATGTAGAAVGTISNIVIGWNWAFEGTGTAEEKTAVDTADTAFASESIAFSMTLTAEQVQ